MGEGYGGLKLRTPRFTRDLYGRSSSSDAQACTVCLRRGQRTRCGYGISDAQTCTDVLEKCLRERAIRMYIRVLHPVKRRRFCNSDAQAVCTDRIRLSMVQTEALPVLELRRPGLIQMCRDEAHLHVCMYSRVVK